MSWWGQIFRRRRFEDELDEELRGYVDAFVMIREL